MPISRYPRRGHPIAPSMLSPLLRCKAKKVGVCLADLDANSWDRFGESMCQALGRTVVQRLSSQASEIVARFGSRRVAPPGSSLKRCQLELEVRTYNCLGNIDVDEREDGIASLTIRDVLSIHAFGVKSLVDLLTSVEAALRAQHAQHGKPDPSGDSARPFHSGRLPEGTCDLLRRSGFIPTSLADTKIPSLPRGTKLQDLKLRVRTENALAKAGFQRNLNAIGELTLRHAIEIPAFGTESLCDLLEAIERHERARYPLFASAREQRDEARILLELIEASSKVPECVWKSSVPPLPNGVHVDELGLRSRTHNVLVREGLADNLEELAKYTIRELSELRGFGRFCTVDLLEKISRIRESMGYTKPASNSAFRRVDKALEQICSLPEVANADQSDPRLGRLLRRLHAKSPTIGDLRSQAEQLAILGRTQEVIGLRDEVQRCCSLSVESELLDILLSKNAAERNKQVISDYYGFGGSPLVTLEVLGTRYKLTRERIRQICAPTKLAKLPLAPFAPALDSAMSLIKDSLPESAKKLEKELESQGLIRNGTTLDGLKRIAHVLRRDAQFECIGPTNSKFVLPKAQVAQLSKIEQMARKLVSKFGAAVIDDVLERCDITISEDKAEQLIVVALGSMKGFRWLDKSTGWFWFDSGHFSRLRPRIRKVLSICGRINVGELRTAIRRDYHLHGRVPPKRILLEICRQMEEVTVDGQDVVAVNDDDPMELIRGDEAILVELLQDYGPLCRMEDLQRLAGEAGVSRPSFWRCLQFCPTIVRYGPCVYGLIGVRVQPGVVESMAGVRRSTRVITDHGWTGDGNVWIAYRVSQGAIESGVVGVPSAKRDFVQGRFRLKTEPGDDEIGQLAVKDASAWGLGPYLRRSGVEEGDYLLIVFNLGKKTASMRVGDEGLLEQYQDAA